MSDANAFSNPDCACPPTAAPSYAHHHLVQYDNRQIPTLHAAAPTSTASPQRQQSRSSVPAHRRRQAQNAIVSYLQIPSSINDSRASLAEFAAQITCLFWFGFDSSQTLQQVEDSRATALPLTPLAREAIPVTGFRKWVVSILSTTQVSQNVIILALLFVYRLKQMNPTVKGKPGSEYRLLTVALMLGNKFLDDNTYTNKTWAEVSGISVQEIHVMEVEFLSNMRYSLYTSAAEWESWHKKLGRFYDYFNAASRASTDLVRNFSSLQLPHALPSPPNSTAASPPFDGVYAQSPAPYLFNSSTPHAHSQLPLAQPSPLSVPAEAEYRPNGRKRSYDDQAQGPPYKKPALVYPLLAKSASSTPQQPPAYGYSLPRLPPLDTAMTSSQSSQAQQPYPQPQTLTLPSLSVPGSRSMATVYPPPVSWSQPHSATFPYANAQTNEYWKRPNPYPTGSGTSSPLSGNYPSMSAHSHNQHSLSPSHYLAKRTSPYRPVRNVSTLLVPPPSGSLHQSQEVTYDQMHYQPLGKPNSERRSGRLPYMPHETWSNPYHANGQWQNWTQPSTR